MDTEWSKIRSEFPALSRFCYLNTAGSGVVSQRVAAAGARNFSDYTQFGGVPSPQWNEQIEKIRANVGRFLGVTPEEIAFVPSTSWGMNLIALMLKQSSKRKVVMSDLEFPSTSLPFLNAGFDVVFVESKNGAAKVEKYAEAADSATLAVVASVTQYLTGWRNDAKELAKVARKNEAYLVLNLNQVAGSFKVNLREADADFACFTGVKWLCAGEVMGVLYVRRQLLDAFTPPVFGWRSVQEPYDMDNRNIVPVDSCRRFELGNIPLPCVFALDEAIKFYEEVGAKRVEDRTLYLSKKLAESLIEAGYSVVTPYEEAKHRSGIIYFEVEDAKEVVERLGRMGVIVSYRRGGVRASIHYYNNEEDIERFIDSLRMVKAVPKRKK
ncbi:MAG: aminotransferase class V-fold PLP-dependent enzyme [Planctomycetota bacterium]|nr:aminotransferase class V-fold PLP-dependent enzyme [Planctomycetota bacterium]